MSQTEGTPTTTTTPPPLSLAEAEAADAAADAAIVAAVEAAGEVPPMPLAPNPLADVPTESGTVTVPGGATAMVLPPPTAGDAATVAPETVQAPAAPLVTVEQQQEADAAASANAAAVTAVPEPAATVDESTDPRVVVAAVFAGHLELAAELVARGFQIVPRGPVARVEGADPITELVPEPAAPPPPPPPPPAPQVGVDVDHEGNPYPAAAPVEQAPVKGEDIPITVEEVLQNLLGNIGAPVPEPVPPAPVDHPDLTTP